MHGTNDPSGVFMLLNFGIHEHHTWLVVAVSGDVDLSNADLMKREIDSAIASGASQIAVDLREVGFMDSTGLRVLIETHNHLSGDDREFAIITKEGPVERLFEITSLQAYLPIRSDLPPTD